MPTKTYWHTIRPHVVIALILAGLINEFGYPIIGGLDLIILGVVAIHGAIASIRWVVNKGRGNHGSRDM